MAFSPPHLFLVHVKSCSVYQMIAWTIASTKADRSQHYIHAFCFRGPNFSAHYLTLGCNKEICAKKHPTKSDSSRNFPPLQAPSSPVSSRTFDQATSRLEIQKKRRRQRLMLDVVTPKHISRHSFDQEKVLAEFEERKEMGKFMWCFFGQVRLMKHHCLFPDR